MANPLAKLFVEISARGADAVRRVVGQVGENVEKTATSAKKAETNFKKALDSGSRFQEILSKLAAPVAVATSLAAIGTKLRENIAAAREFQAALDEQNTSLRRQFELQEAGLRTGFEQFKTEREVLQAVNDRAKSRQDELDAIIESDNLLKQTARGITSLFTSAPVTLGARQRAIDAANARDSQQATKLTEKLAKDSAKREVREREKLRAEERAKEAKRIEDETKKRLEAERKVSEEKERLAQQRFEREQQRIAQLAEAQIDAARETANAVNALRGEAATGINQILREVQRLVQAQKNGGK